MRTGTSSLMVSQMESGLALPLLITMEMSTRLNAALPMEMLATDTNLIEIQLARVYSSLIPCLAMVLFKLLLELMEKMTKIFNQ